MSEKILKIYSSNEWLIPGKNHIVLLFPWLGKIELPVGDPDHGRFEEYYTHGKSCFQWVEDLEQCDISVFPHELIPETQFLEKLRSFAAAVKLKNKKLLVFYNSDDDQPIDINNSILFRTSFYKGEKKSNTLAVPGWSVDFKKYFPEQKISWIRDYQLPSVSYCGYIDYEKRNIKDFLIAFGRKSTVNNEMVAKALRGKACRTLRANKKIKTDFLIRNGFWAAGINDKQKARKEYAENMINSLYAVVARGGGNFSYRLYEVLSCGRIPVFINTDCVLPFDEIIDWKKHVVWVEFNEMERIDKILYNFHIQKTPEQLLSMQINNRKLYEEYISPLGFHSKLNRLLIPQL